MPRTSEDDPCGGTRIQNCNNINNSFSYWRKSKRKFTGAMVMGRAIVLLLIATHSLVTVGAQPPEVNEGLVFAVEPKDTTVRKFGPAWLHCVVQNHHSGPSTVTWIKDGAPINLQQDSRRHLLSNNTLYIEAMTSPRSDRSDEGTYQCLASSHTVGAILSTPATLSIARLTKFTQVPKDLRAYEGEKARFACSVTVDSSVPTESGPPADLVRADYWSTADTGAGGGGSDVEVLWHRNDVPLHLDSRMTVLPSGSLEISNLALSDAGKYHCHVMSHGKTKVSDSADLLVAEAYALRDPTPPVFIAKPSSRVVSSGQNLTFDCAANGFPDPTITWLKDGSTIDMQNLDSRFHLLPPTHSLHITDARVEDAGSYMCRAENRMDSVDAVAHLTVRVAPRVTTAPPAIVTAKARQDVELQCIMEGLPQPRVTWYKNAELIRYSEYFQLVNGHNLKILGLVPGDAGMYQCFGENVVGSTQATTRLVLISDDQENDNSGTEEHSSSTVSSSNDDGWNVPSISTHNSTSIMDGSTSQYSPSSPRNVIALSSGNRHITLNWQSPALNNEYVDGYLVYYRRKHSDRERVWAVNASPSAAAALDSTSPDEYKTQINKLTPGTTYIIRVAASASVPGTLGQLEAAANAMSRIVGASSPTLEVSTRADVDLPAAPTNLTVTPVSSTELEVRWAPPQQQGGSAPITGYKLFYMEVGSAEEQHILLPVSPSSSPPTSHLLSHLHQFTAYSVWLVAVNRHGDGNSPREVVARTFSDIPSDVPQNVRVEAASSRSLIIRWEPPPLQHQNGIITGYKIRFKERGGSNGGTRTPDGSRRLIALNGLKRDTSYSIKMSALTVNGSGPVSPWIHTKTFANDLDESSVPGKPTNLIANPKSTSITIRWDPPTTSSTTLVRGYTIGWGLGIPDVYAKNVDSSKRRHTIDGLEPNAEYVISVRASNVVGDGQPVYEQVSTRPPEPEPQHRLLTPVGLKAEVMTAFGIALSWIDATLNSNQYIGDRGYYTVRYTTYASASSSSPRYKYVNVSDVTCLIDHLKPATMYEFTVKAVKGNRESPWSLVATNTTLEAKPSSSPRDVTVVTIRDPTTVVFNWQPPRQANGRITGYLVYYTTDPNLQWAVEQVAGTSLTTTLSSLTPQTTYYYKLQARNSKGHSPFTTVSNFTTLPASASIGSGDSSGGVSMFDKPSTVMVVGLCLFGVVVLIATVAGFLYCIFCRRKPPVEPATRNTGTLKSNKVEVIQPPDLWIHHDRLELKNMENHNPHSGGGTRPSSPLHATTVLSHTDAADMDDKNTTYTSTSTLDRRTPYHSTYLRDAVAEEETERLLHHRHSFRPKPFIASVSPDQYMVGGSTSSSVYSDGTLGRVPQSSGAVNPPPYCMDPPPYSGETSCSNTLGKAQRSAAGSSGGPGNPLRSFSVPAPPQSAPTTPHPKHYGGLHPPSSPFKKLPPSTTNCSSILGSSAPPPIGGRRVLPPIGRVDSLPEEECHTDGVSHLTFNERGDLVGGVSTEELSQEMANLEGLMKDLSALTANEFN